MSLSSIILRNIASNWTGFAVSAAVTLILTPIVLQELGEARYGIWVLTSSIVGYYGLLDLGFRGSVNQYLTRYIAVRDYSKASECMSSAVVILVLLGVFMALLSVLAAFFVPVFFSLPEGLESEAFWCIMVVGFASALQCAFFPFASIFTATQRFDLANLIGVSSRLLMALGIYTALQSGYGLVGISIVTCGANLLDYLIRWKVAHYLVPELQISWHRIYPDRVREMASFGGWNFLIAINTFVYLHASTLLIGFFLPIAAVGYYALATGLWRQINEILTPIGQVIYPAAVSIHARDEQQTLERLYRDGTRIMLLAVMPLVLIAGFWAEDFYRLWIGEQYLSGKQYPSVALLLQVLLFSTLASYASNTMGQILLGAGRVKLLALLMCCSSLLSLALSVILIHSMGLYGIAIASVCAAVVIGLIALPLAAQITLHLPITGFLWACVRPLILGLLLVPLILGIRSLSSATTWPSLITHGLIITIGSAVLVAGVGLSSGERSRFLFQPFKRLLSLKRSNLKSATEVSGELHARQS